jgi:putative phage-type endonuclease
MSEAFEVVCDSRDREKWLAERRKGIGSSDAAAILGCSPWASALSTYVEKTTDDVPPKEDTERMKWGRLLEPIILAEFAKDAGRLVQPGGVLLRSVERPWQLATLDGSQRDGDRGEGIVEVKTSGHARHWDEGVPPEVGVQVQHQMAVTGLAWASVVVLLGGSRLYHVDIERDGAFIAAMNEAEADFWDRVTRNLPPAPDGTEASRAALKALWPRDTGETIALPGEFLDLDREREGLLVERNRVAKDLEVIDQRIKAALADATEGTLPSGVRYTYRTQQRKETVLKAAEFRVLRRHGKGGTS